MSISFFSPNIAWQIQDGRFETEAEVLNYFKTMGVDCIDVFSSDFKEYPLSYYVNLLSDAGMKANCVVTFEAIADFNDRVRACQIAKVRESLELMAVKNIPMMMLQPSMSVANNEYEYKKRQELVVKGFSELTAYAKELGVMLTIENMSFLNRSDSTIGEIEYILENVTDLGFVLDTGNFFCVGEDVIKAYETFKDRVVHIHCKDWKWDIYGDFVRENIPRFRGCALGEGDVPLKQLLKTIKQDGYSGDLAVEINSPIGWDKFDESIRFVKENY